MQGYLKVSLLLCGFGFLREMRPSEPFVTEFLLSPEWRNITESDLNRKVYPIGTYSYLALLFVVFLITDILRYKPIMIVSSLFGVGIYSLLLWTETLYALQIVQVLYGYFMAAEVAYYTYIYARVDRKEYQAVTGHVRAATLSGRFTASLMGQLLVSFGLMNLRELNYITLSAQGLSFFFAVLLPGVGVSMYFYAAQKRQSGIDEEPGESIESLADEKPKFSFEKATSLMWSHFTQAYSNTSVLQSSVWWAMVMCGFYQVQSYVQFLWKEIDPESEDLYNGGVEAGLTLLGAGSAILASRMNLKLFDRYQMWILAVCAVLEGGFVMVSAFTKTVAVAYAMYILFGVLYNFMITLISAHVAQQLADDSFGLIFGINTFLALVLQSFLTLTVVSESGLELEIRGQFISYGIYFIILFCIYALIALIKTLYRLRTTTKSSK